jgi:DNA-binding MarR family transcriptional regulator
VIVGLSFGRDGPLHAVLVWNGRESASNRSIDIGVDLGRHCSFLPGSVRGYTCRCKYRTLIWLQMQVPVKTDTAELLERLVMDELPNRRGLEAWASLLSAHATLMRRLETDLEEKTGLALADFDVLAQLAVAGGHLRMTELASRALISRSGMTRRVARLVDEGLVRRASADSDARGVVVSLTDAGVARLAETAPIHARGVVHLFVAPLDDQELGVLKTALDKVTVDCTFG